MEFRHLIQQRGQKTFGPPAQVPNSHPPNTARGQAITPRVQTPKHEVNLEPLLINTNGSWEHRPDATTKIENLFLASDYVRTYTDLATMEAANEAARWAVNGLLCASNSNAHPCWLWPRNEAELFAWARLRDRRRFRQSDATAFDRGAALLRDLEVLDPRRSRRGGRA